MLVEIASGIIVAIVAIHLINIVIYAVVMTAGEQFERNGREYNAKRKDKGV